MGVALWEGFRPQGGVSHPLLCTPLAIGSLAKDQFLTLPPSLSHTDCPSHPLGGSSGHLPALALADFSPALRRLTPTKVASECGG